jgi:clathrin heavy chain
MGVFTELGLMYAAHSPERLMEHLKLFAKRLNIPRLLRCCEQHGLWRELAHLYAAYDEHDNAAAVMMAHPSAWEHVAMKDVVVRAGSADALYRAIAFYLEQHPDLLHDLMRCCEGRLDHARAVALFRKAGQLPLAKAYLLGAQKSGANLVEVNEAVNDLLLDEEDFAGLRDSISRHDAFDQVALAARLERHELLEMRRLAALVYKRNLRWRKAVELAKADGLFKDAAETVAASGQPELAEELLRWFVAKGEKECFAAALYTCYDLLRPDVVLELAWAHGLERWAMPFFVTMLKEYTSKVDVLMSEREEARDAVEQAHGAHKAAAAAVAAMMPLALPAAPGSMPGGGAGGAPMPPPYGGGGGGF